MAETAQSYQDVVESVRRFNEDLKKDVNLQSRLSYFRAWYYVPELNQVGPSKFVGYKGMNAQRYANEINELSGTETEPVLRKWFELLENENDEALKIRNIVEDLLSQYNKKISAIARFNTPYKRIETNTGVIPPSSHKASLKQEDFGTPKPMVEVFWRAFLSLYPEDQSELAERIIKHLRLS